MNIPEVKTSYKYATELCECLENSLKLAQEELQKSQKRYKKYYDRKAKPRSKTKTYHLNMLKKYIAREPEANVVHTSNKDAVTIAVAGVIYHTGLGGLSSERRCQIR